MRTIQEAGVDRRLVVLATALLALAALLTGCTLATASGTNGNAAPAGAGGTIVWGKNLDVTHMDPQVSSDAADWEFFSLVYNSLVAVDNSGHVVPSLATAWTQTSPTTYVFTLRHGVKFSNGQPLTAADVAGSLTRIASPKTGSYWQGHLGIKTASVSGPSQVTVTLEAPRDSFIAALAGPMAAILPMKELDAGTFDPTKQLLGTGPYMVKSHVENQSWVFVRNPYYWGTRARAAELDVEIMPDDAARLAGLRDGSIDVATFASPDAVNLLKGQANVTTLVQNANSYYRLDVNAKTSLFSNPLLRQALALAINRKQIAQVAFGGIGDPTAAIIPAFGVCPAADMPYATPDPSRARQLVRQAGAVGKTVVITATTGGATYAPIAQVLQQEIAATGLNAQIVQPQYGTYLANVYGKTPKFDVSISFSDNYSESSMILDDYDPAVAVFNTGYVQPDQILNEEISKANSDPGGAARDAAEKQACSSIAKDANMIPLITKPTIVAYRSDKIAADVTPLAPFTVPLPNIAMFSVK